MLNHIANSVLSTNQMRGARLPSEVPSNAPKVTVVVPVYGDLDSLVLCVRALIETIDESRHEVLLVNDCGPEADAIEAALLELIADQPLFRYERNDQNLGFVGTCNRAAMELDRSDNDILLLNSDTEPRPGFLEELQAVLYADEHHGVVCARSNNATIASLPYRITGRGTSRSVERTETVFNELSDALPRWSVSPVAMGFCFLVRRTLITRFGLFDDFFAPGYGEENDFCLRVDQAGYRAVIANRALVIHEGSKSFVGERRNALRDAHQKKLEARYPYYGRAIRAFMRFGTEALERFADAFVPGSDRLTFGIDIRGLSALASDTAQHRSVIDQVRALALGLSSDSDVEVFADSADLAALRLNPARIRQSLEVTSDEVLHVGLMLVGGIDASKLAIANRRYAFWAGWSLEGPVTSWDKRVSRLGLDIAGEYLRRFATATFEGAAAPSPDDLRRVLADQHQLPRDRRRTRLEDRWAAFRLVDSVPSASSATDARVRKLESDLDALRDSLSYRIGSRAVGAAKRIVRR